MKSRYFYFFIISTILFGGLWFYPSPNSSVFETSQSQEVQLSEFEENPNIQLNLVVNNWRELNLSTSPSARRGAAMAYDPLHRKMILFGGETSLSIYNDETWAYDYSTNSWTNMNPAIAPVKRGGHSMVYDPILRAIVLFGGFGSNDYQDTWAYDYSKNTWTNLNPTSSPDKRMNHVHVYDSFQKKHILFGGGGTTSHDDTWEYDSSVNTWTQLLPSSIPPTYSNIEGSYDIKNQKTILFAGQSGCCASSLTWAYDYNTTTWTFMDPASSPGSRISHGMEYDPWSEKILVFGGHAGTGERLNDTWEYNFASNTWNNILHTIAPPARESMTMSYDNFEQKFMVFGGEDADPFPYLSDTWILNGSLLFDVVVPTISSPSNTTIEAGSGENIISWIVDDQLPDYYSITINGTEVGTANWISGNLDYKVDFLPRGVHIINLTIFDSQGNSAFDIVQITVVDTLAPVVESAGDVIFEFGNLINTLEWTVHDPHPDKYVIVDESSQEILASDNWTDGQIISLNVDSILGVRSIRLTINDTLGHETSHSVNVDFSDRIDPNISGPVDLTYKFAAEGNLIEWVVDDLLPANYSISADGVEIESGNWTAKDKISISVDGLNLGNYIYQLTIWDTSGNQATDIVKVSVVEEVLSTLDEIISEADTDPDIAFLPIMEFPLLLISIFSIALILNRRKTSSSK